MAPTPKSKRDVNGNAFHCNGGYYNCDALLCQQAARCVATFGPSNVAPPREPIPSAMQEPTVKRWIPDYWRAGAFMTQKPEGEWVAYEDYETLMASLASLRAENDALKQDAKRLDWILARPNLEFRVALRGEGGRKFSYWPTTRTGIDELIDDELPSNYFVSRLRGAGET